MAEAIQTGVRTFNEEEKGRDGDPWQFNNESLTKPWISTKVKFPTKYKSVPKIALAVTGIHFNNTPIGHIDYNVTVESPDSEGFFVRISRVHHGAEIRQLSINWVSFPVI
jgi:hypothetical protein